MTPNTLNRSDLMTLLMQKNNLTPAVAERVVITILDQMSEALAQGGRIEIRGFGSFESRQRNPRKARNPKTGETLQTKAKRSVHFKPGKELRERVDASKTK
jgi:integration host factor subunit beta